MGAKRTNRSTRCARSSTAKRRSKPTPGSNTRGSTPFGRTATAAKADRDVLKRTRAAPTNRRRTLCPNGISAFWTQKAPPKNTRARKYIKVSTHAEAIALLQNSARTKNNRFAMKAHVVSGKDSNLTKNRTSNGSIRCSDRAPVRCRLADSGPEPDCNLYTRKSSIVLGVSSEEEESSDSELALK